MAWKGYGFGFRVSGGRRESSWSRSFQLQSKLESHVAMGDSAEIADRVCSSGFGVLGFEGLGFNPDQKAVAKKLDPRVTMKAKLAT